LADIFDSVLRGDEPVVISRHNKQEVVVISREQWEHLKALEDAADVGDAEAAMAEPGPSIPLEQIKRDLGI